MTDFKVKCTKFDFHSPGSLTELKGPTFKGKEEREGNIREKVRHSHPMYPMYVAKL